MTHFAKEELTFDDNGDAIYTVKIRDFHNKMKLWSAGCAIDSKHFTLKDLDLYLRVYPNGNKFSVLR